jgi:hypothetical protein
MGKWRVMAAAGLTALATAAAVRGDIDRAITEAGAATLSGGRGQIESWGAGGWLLTANNKMDDIGLTWSPHTTGIVDAILGVDAANRDWLIGFILQDTDGVHYTYDRLARVPVLQVLGRDNETGGPPSFSPAPRPASPRPMTYGSGGSSAGSGAKSGGSGGRQGEGGMLMVPEPAVLLLLLVGALTAFGGRSHGRSQED